MCKTVFQSLKFRSQLRLFERDIHAREITSHHFVNDPSLDSLQNLITIKFSIFDTSNIFSFLQTIALHVCGLSSQLTSFCERLIFHSSDRLITE